MRIGPRWLIVLPFLVLVVVTVVGGWVNTTDAKGRLVDDYTDKGVKGGTVAAGTRSTTTDENGDYVLSTIPRTAKVQIDALGYQRQSVAAGDVGDVRLSPLSVTIYAYDATKTTKDYVKNPEARDLNNTKDLAVGNESGQIIIAPHPGRDAQVLLCAKGFDQKTITVEGVLMQIGMDPGTNECSPLPTPTPAPSPSATPVPSGSPAASPTAAPTPSPTATP